MGFLVLIGTFCSTRGLLFARGDYLTIGAYIFAKFNPTKLSLYKMIKRTIKILQQNIVGVLGLTLQQVQQLA